MNNLFGLANFCKLTLSDAKGNIISETEKQNITCTAGRASMAKRLFDNSITDLGVIKYIAVGSGTQTAAEALVKLNTETARSLLEVGRSTITGTQIKVYARFGVGTSLTITEAGVFTDATATGIADSGSLLCYSTGFASITKGSAEMLTVEWTINVQNSTI